MNIEVVRTDSNGPLSFENDFNRPAHSIDTDNVASLELRRDVELEFGHNSPDETMSIKELLPSRTEVSLPKEAEVFDLSSDEADQVFSALSSDTARQILAALYEEPQTASEVADRLDLSLQNVDYHLKNLQEADLVQIASTEYSQTGNEMKIYGPSTNAVLVLSSDSVATRIRSMVANLFSALLVIGVAAVVYRTVLFDGFIDVPTVEVGPFAEPREDVGEPDEVDDVDDSPDTAPEEGEDPADTLLEPEQFIETVNPLEHLPLLLDPGIAFALGGLVAITVVLGIRWYRTRSR